MRYLKYTIIVCLTLLISSNISAQEWNELSVPLSEPGKKGTLHVHTHTGKIKVTGTTRNDILVKYASTEKQRKDNRKSKNGLKRISSPSLDLEISEHHNEVNVRSHNHNKGIQLDIEIPKNMDLQLSTHNNAFIDVDNVSGVLELTSHNGPISATNISGSVLADTHNGEIIVTFDEVTPNTPMAFSTYNGEIDLTLPANVVATMKAKTRNGEIYTGFDMVMEKQTVEPNTKGKSTSYKSKEKEKYKSKNKGNAYRVKIGEWTVGKINGGGPEFTLKGYNGDIFIRKKE